MLGCWPVANELLDVAMWACMIRSVLCTRLFPANCVCMATQSTSAKLDVAPLKTHQRSIDKRLHPAAVNEIEGNRLIFGCAIAPLGFSYVLHSLDERFMGRIYVPKPPKKRKNWISKSTVIARAVFDSLSTSKELGPVVSRRIPSVCFPFLFRDHLRFLRRSRYTSDFQFDVQVPMLRMQPQLATRH